MDLVEPGIQSFQGRLEHTSVEIRVQTYPAWTLEAGLSARHPVVAALAQPEDIELERALVEAPQG